MPEVRLEYSNFILDINGENMIIFSHRILCDGSFNGYRIESECKNENCFFKNILDKTNSSR